MRIANMFPTTNNKEIGGEGRCRTERLFGRASSGMIAIALLATIHTGANATLPKSESTIVVGSKNFTESAVLAELMAQIIEAETDLVVERRINLGGTMICWEAVRSGEIDLYAEYTGTAWSAILKEEGKITDPLRTFFHVQRRSNDEHGVRWLDPFGLNNTYALAMSEERAETLDIRRISDLVRHQSSISAGFSIEFGNREDGYLGLANAYGLKPGTLRTLEHGLAYEAVDSGAIDLIDAYSTDAKLLRYRLRVLEDDRRFFPPYNAAPVVNGTTLDDHPELGRALSRLSFAVDDATAQALNYVVENEGASPAEVARAFLRRQELIPDAGEPKTNARIALDRVLGDLPTPGSRSSDRPGFLELLPARAKKTFQLLLQHLGLTLAAVFLAALVSIPLGILITRMPRARQILLGIAGAIQTIPSLALLAFMIPILGLDVKAAIAALFLYAILPILRNTYTGIAEVDPDLVDAARGMGMRQREILRKVQLPLAMRTIMAGIRTSTVISVGVATLAAFIGAGGLGEPIVEGLYLNDSALILTGAVPAAVLAISVDLILGKVETILQPRMSQGSP